MTHLWLAVDRAEVLSVGASNDHDSNIHVDKAGLYETKTHISRVSHSVFVLDETLVRSPRKLVILIAHENIYELVASKNDFI